jgi:hypothetical protein
VEGDIAVLKSSINTSTPQGDSSSEHTYAIDRGDYSQAAAPDGVDAEDQHHGMVISQPQHPSKEAFRVYDTITQPAQQVDYQDSTTIAGRDVLVFDGTATAPVRDPALLEQLTGAIGTLVKTGNGTTMPKPMIEAMIEGLGSDKAAQFKRLLATLPAEVPLTFLSTNQLTVAIDAELGAPIRSEQTQRTEVAIDTGAEPMPVLAISEVHLAQTPASSRAIADDLGAAARKLAVVSTWVPAALAVLGILLLGFALRVRRRGASLPIEDAAGASGPAETEPELATGR